MAAPETNLKLEDSKYNLVNNDYVFSVFAGFCLLGNVIKIYFGKIQPDGSSGPASATLWGYTIICFSLITILFVATTIGNDKPFEKLLSSGLPVMLLLLLLLWTISLNLKYYDKINKGLVAEEYYTWSRVSTTITIFQMVLIILYVKNVFFKKIHNLPVPKGSDKGMVAGYFLVLLNSITIGIQQIVLDYFTTDG